MLVVTLEEKVGKDALAWSQRPFPSTSARLAAALACGDDGGRYLVIESREIAISKEERTMVVMVERRKAEEQSEKAKCSRKFV